MKIDLSAQYDPKAVETNIYARWQEQQCFAAAPDARPAAEHFSVVIPPPNVTGALHLGHAINNTVQDILTRYHRMRGDNTLWMPGIDHAGIATQAIVEKTIFEKEKKTRHDLGREELVRRIWEWKEQYGTRILTQLAAMGASCDWNRTRFTLDETCAKAVREAFFKMFSDGLIFRGKRLVNWDTHLQTAVADDEIYHETVKGQMTSIKYPVDGQLGEFLVVATTRPETMLGDTAVAVHPEDPRYRHLIGQHVIVPLVGRRIPIIADGLLVDPKFGTGVVKVTPAHDPNDYATGQRHKLELINLLTADGKVNDHGAGEFQGKSYSYAGLRFATAARKQVLADLEALGLIVETKVHEHEVGHSDRSKTPIEPYLSDQWFVRMGDLDNGIKLANGTAKPGLAQAAMDAVTDGRVKITPERYAKGYLDWLGQKRDWCISRQLWWGHRIPVWSRHFAPDERPCVQGYSCPKDFLKTVPGCAFHVVKPEDGHVYVYACLRDQTQAATLEAHGFVQDPDVLDTWFSSALWPISTLGWPAGGTSEKPEDQLLSYYYPTSVLSTARDILTLWVARMVMFGLYCHGDVPFRDVYIHAVIQDGDGRTMSKSKGNGVDPVDIIASHGADALRFTLASMATETQDIRMPVVKDAKTGRNTSPKFDIGRNFANKIWNAARFILTNVEFPIQPLPAQLPLEDRWILSRLHRTVAATQTAITQYHFADYASAVYQFLWSDLCDWYLEIAKARMRAGDATVQAVLAVCLETALKLLHPMMPFVTEEIWSKLPNRTSPLIVAAWPKADTWAVDAPAEAQIALTQQLTSAVREIQNRYPAAKGKPVVIRPRTEELKALILANRGIIEPLSGNTFAEVATTATKPADAAASVLPELEIYIGGVIDRAAESQKLTARQAELQKFIASNQTKLANEAFTSKAPAKVVEGMRTQLAQHETELAAITKNLAELQV